ncbi:hypothetical protein KUL97_10535 [Synechococcus sp. HK05]|uniref:hypothetical protein n=1 Tax=Synechococcus sp. HK05 TaxID=2725975 RepID=UPI001C382C39|nr:hypothetical protein [Synechococcus sp. HK05]MBV2352140.1 hypothetical protein [Synechococcus sp. HK05]
MTARRCILHIGICKTGTTSIQYSLAANREALADAGIVVPRTLGPTHNHRHLTLLGVDGDTEAGQREWDVMRHRTAGLQACGSLNEAKQWVERSLAAELAMVPASSWVVFSSEQLSQRLLTHNAVLRLRQALERIGFETVRVVVYLREQVGLSMSWESMQVIAGHTVQDPLETPSAFNHQELLERWEGVWGHKSMIVRTYARPFLHQGDVVSDFELHALPFAGEYLKASRTVRRNERLGQRSILLLRQANHWLPKMLPRPVVEPARRALVQMSRLHWISGKPEKEVKPATFRALAKQFRDSNQWVDQAYGTHLEESFGTT